MYGQVTDNPALSDRDLSSSSSSSTLSPTSGVDNVTLYIVFGVAFVVFIAVVLVLVKILRGKSANPNGYTLTPTGMYLLSAHQKTSFHLVCIRRYGFLMLRPTFCYAYIPSLSLCPSGLSGGM